jgi:hypothetical protein
VTEGHSSGTDDFEASAATTTATEAIDVGSDAEGKLGGHDGLAVTATDSQWRCPRVAEVTEG